jgi:two-component system response regulator YesN
MISHCDLATAEETQEDVNGLFSCFNENGKLNSETLYYLYKKITSNMFTRYPGYTDSDMYLHIKSIMIENIFEFTNLLEWQSSVQDYAVYLSALLKQNTKESPYITEALEFIKTHFKKNINMAMVANQVSVNYTWFSEKFKEHTGVNFNEYLKRLRIEEAKSLLEKGCYKVYEVAERSGFSDVKYFMKIFREETGLSPTEWSNKHNS